MEIISTYFLFLNEKFLINMGEPKNISGLILFDTPSRIVVPPAIDESESCQFPKHEWLLVKFIFMSVIGTCVAVSGIFGNLTIAAVLMQPAMRTANNLYLTILAIFDTLVLLPGMMLYSLEYVNEYFDRADLYIIWIQFVPYCYSLSHFAQTGSVYITVSVTFERYLAVLHPKTSSIVCTRHRAVVTVISVICFAALFNCTKIFEIEVAYHDNCTGFSSRELVASELLRNPLYNTVYGLWLTQFVMVFLPFGVLLTFNTAIAWSFKRSLRQLNYIGMPSDRIKIKEQSRDSTRVLVTIVLVFLICNCWGFVTTLLESIYGHGALIEWAPEFYTFSREAINFLAIVNSSINFVICCTFGEDFRHELLKLCGCRRRTRRRRGRRKAFSGRSSPVLQVPRNSAGLIPGLRYVDRVSVDDFSICDEDEVRNFDPTHIASFAALIEAAKNMVGNGSIALQQETPMLQPAPTLPVQNNNIIDGGRTNNGVNLDHDFSQDYFPAYLLRYPRNSRLDLETTI